MHGQENNKNKRNKRKSMRIKFSLNISFYRPFFETTVLSPSGHPRFSQEYLSLFLRLWKTQNNRGFLNGILKKRYKEILLWPLHFPTLMLEWKRFIGSCFESCKTAALYLSMISPWNHAQIVYLFFFEIMHHFLVFQFPWYVARNPFTTFGFFCKKMNNRSDNILSLNFNCRE